jgi:hypothetical protein
MPSNFADIAQCCGWLALLAAPRLWNALPRIPPKEHLLFLIDAFLPYAHSDRYYSEVPPGKQRADISQRGPAAERLRQLLLRWEPPALTQEIREAARAVILADGGAEPVGGWDNYEPDPHIAVEETILWPEGTWEDYQRAAAIIPPNPLASAPKEIAWNWPPVGDGGPYNDQIRDAIYCSNWLWALAAPRIWSTLPRLPTKDLLVKVVEAYLPYAHGPRYKIHADPRKPPPDPAIRGPLADRLHALLLAWEPPKLTKEIRTAARALLLVEGSLEPKEGWDNHLPRSMSTLVEHGLIWPEQWEARHREKE